ncbi:MAG: flagellin [Oxalobacter formigenes]|nr:flagellin [Oxalobacter formigenes]
MSAFINTNVSALNTLRGLDRTQHTQDSLMEKLASGKRINRAKDDPAGLQIAALMTAQTNGMNQAIRNAYDGISLSQTAEGSLSTSAQMLGRIRELAVQASNATYSPADRQALQEEANQLLGSLDRIAGTASFNGQKLLDGSAGAQTFQVGANAGETVSVGGTNFHTAAYGNNRLEGTAAVPGASIEASRFTVSGGAGSAVIETAAGASSREVAEAINRQQDKTGVTATAVTEVNLGNLAAGQSYAFSLQPANDSPVSVSFTVGADGDLSAAAKAFNDQAARTGVRAQVDANTGGIKLTNAAGDTIALAAVPNHDRDMAERAVMAAYDVNGNLSAAAEVPEDAGNMTAAAGRVSLNSPEAFSITQDPAPGSAGFVMAGSSSLDSVASISVATFEDAQRAIATVDSALASISSERARYGAIQNRFTGTIGNLMTGSEKTAAAKSRIADTDYAQEVTKQSRAMLLQRVGVAMQAQANQIPQMVLSLLR